MLTAFLDSRAQKRVALVHFPKAVQHFRQLGRVDRLHGNLDHRRRIESQRSENFGLFDKIKIKTCKLCLWLRKFKQHYAVIF
jgi:hypothetical protein